MDDKLKRECKPFLEKLFKQHDDVGSGAVSMQAMKKIMDKIIPDFTQMEELNELMTEVARRTKYTALNKSTNQFEVQYQENSIDFPSALYICVHFLKKLERRNTDCFSGRSVVKMDDLNGMNLNPIEGRKKDTDHRKRLF